MMEDNEGYLGSRATINVSLICLTLSEAPPCRCLRLDRQRRNLEACVATIINREDVFQPINASSCMASHQ